MNTAVKSIVATLGGERSLGGKVRTSMDLISLTRKGITKKAIYALAKALSISMETMAKTLHTTPRTLQRKKDTDHLDVYISEQAIEVAEVIAKGQEVFGSLKSFQSWLREPSLALGGQRPLDILDTSIGTRMVLTELGRIEHGVFS